METSVCNARKQRWKLAHQSRRRHPTKGHAFAHPELVKTEAVERRAPQLTMKIAPLELRKIGDDLRNEAMLIMALGLDARHEIGVRQFPQLHSSILITFALSASPVSCVVLSNRADSMPRSESMDIGRRLFARVLWIS